MKPLPVFCFLLGLIFVAWVGHDNRATMATPAASLMKTQSAFLESTLQLKTAQSAPVIAPANFVSHINNPAVTSKPNKTFAYRGTKDGKPARLGANVMVRDQVTQDKVAGEDDID